MDTTLAKKVVFDIVSSVKGGSGKSTYSLLLAAYYNAQPNTIAYVLDLDLRGTSWEKNYGIYINTRFFENQDENSLSDYYNASCEEALALQENSKEMRKRYIDYPFINSLMWNFKAFKSREFWSEINYKAEYKDKLEEKIIRLCPACVQDGAEIDQLEVDIFEYTISQIILYILEHHYSHDDDKEEVHIILDMPPNYEKHAEAVVKHLLTNNGSKLFQTAKNRDGCFKVNSNLAAKHYLPYQIHLFMLCAISPAHLEQNSYYLYRWLKDRKYSDGLVDLLNDKRECRRFKVSFILNDISQILPNLIRSEGEVPSDIEIATWAQSVSDQRKADNSSYYTQVISLMNGLVEDGGSHVVLRAFPHLSLPATNWYWSTSIKPQSTQLKIEKGIIDAIENTLKQSGT